MKYVCAFLQYVKICNINYNSLGGGTVDYFEQFCAIYKSSKEEIVMAPPGRAAKGLMIYIHSTVEIDIDIELSKARLSC